MGAAASILCLSDVSVMLMLYEHMLLEKSPVQHEQIITYK